MSEAGQGAVVLGPYQALAWPETLGLRLDVALATHWLELDLSRERVKQLIQQGHVQVNGKVCNKPALAVAVHHTVTLALPPNQPLALAAEALPLDVVFEDESLIVLNKAAGMLTHPTGQHRSGTLVNALLYHCKGQLSGINGTIRPGIVHRLDRDTAGLMVVAKTDVAHKHLTQQLQDKTMQRHYWAIVQGIPPQQQGVCEWPLMRHPTKRNLVQVAPPNSVAKSRHALTHWQVERTLGNSFAWLGCQLATGRTHQIRVHMATMGHPLVGDEAYGTGLHKVWALPAVAAGQWLQAYRLALVHPLTGQAMVWQRPPDLRLAQGWEVLAARV